MSIDAIDSVSSLRRPSALDMYSTYINQMPYQPQPTQSDNGTLGQLLAMLMYSLLSASQQGAQGQGAPGQGATGGNSWPGNAGSSGAMPGASGLSGPGSAGNNSPLSGAQGIFNSILELFQALSPLLQALNQNGMQPNNTAGQLADQLGGGGGGYPSTPSTPGTPSTPVSGAKPTEIPPATGTVTVDKPIVVKAGETFDGGGKLFQAGAALGDGGQSENQKPVFILEPGATLQNVQVAGGDGVHTRGDATLKDVWWKDVGEDAMTMKGPGNVKVSGGGAYQATDKIFQINAPGSLSIDGFTADGFGKAVRTNGGKDFPITIDIKNSVFRNGDEAVVRTDASQAKIRLADDVVVENVPNDVIAPPSAQVEGAKSLIYKPYSG